jgi:SAM-dependent methyltransferase
MPDPAATGAALPLAARLEPFDSFWQAPLDVERGYAGFAAYYRHNWLPHLPPRQDARILVVSCGPGYLVKLLHDRGYTQVIGIDSDPAKIAHAQARGLPCRTARAFPFLEAGPAPFDVIIAEQELNHLTLDETIRFLGLCRRNLEIGGLFLGYGLNGANPLVGAENLAHNIDHFYTLTDHSFGQLLGLAGFADVKVRPLELYVFWKNPLNYVGLACTRLFELACRLGFILYGKDVKILSKKLMATARNIG